MDKPELTYLLGKILGLSYNGKKAEVEKALSDSEMDWIGFTKRANRYLILPTLYYELNKAELLHLLPEELKLHLADIFELSTQRNQAIEKQLNHVTGLLNKEGIVPILLKGGGNLVQGLYPHKGVRIMTDVDMLVGDEHFLQAAELLKSDGYKTDIEFNDIYTSIEQAKDYPRLFKANVPADIEIHRLPVATEFKKHFNYDVATQNLCVLDAENNVAVLSTQNNVLLNFIHSQLTDKAFLYKYVNLKNMYDLWLLSKKVDVEKVFANFGHYRKEAFAYWGATQLLFTGTIKGNKDVIKGGKRYVDAAMYYIRNPKKYQRDKKRRYVFWRIGYSYIKFPISTLLNASNRKLLFKKLTSAAWYNKHFRSFK